ncbi:MAG: carboxypeptidase regulatory-like domain-containing protein [Chitinophagaceae bacterium]|nr:MAG: carboxypeptidase regulatory-like domain-containing protein [Chitinophagaceae bacterium]
MKKICLLFISLLGYSALFAQSFYLSGKTVDALGKSISNASITVVETGRTIQSDNNGIFAFTNIPKGKYEFVITHTGYQKMHKNQFHCTAIVRLSDGKHTEARIY